MDGQLEIGEGLDKTVFHVAVVTPEENGVQDTESLGWLIRSPKGWIAISPMNVDQVGGPFKLRRDALKFLAS